MQQDNSYLRRWLSIYATALAIVVAVLGGIILAATSGAFRADVAELSIGLDLIASAIFALIFASLVTWVLDRNQRASMNQLLSASNSELIMQIASLETKYLPSAEFPALDGFGEKFNRALMESIEGSKIYDFYGPSPRFVAARLKRIRRSPEEVRVAMMDPALGSAIIRRAADREKWQSSAGKGLDQLEREFREELRMAIVSLFDFRTTCPVRVVYTSDLVVYRTELTDDDVFFSWYHGPSSSGKEMPESAQFGNDSLYYQVIRNEMSRRFEVLPRKVAFDATQSDTHLIQHLQDITGESYGPDDLVRVRREYLVYTKELTDYLIRIGY
jgi:hypothetical protein